MKIEKKNLLGPNILHTGKPKAAYQYTAENCEMSVPKSLSLH